MQDNLAAAFQTDTAPQAYVRERVAPIPPVGIGWFAQQAPLVETANSIETNESVASAFSGNQFCAAGHANHQFIQTFVDGALYIELDDFERIGARPHELSVDKHLSIKINAVKD